MTAANHALTGAVFGLVLNQPFVAVFLALASHFALDALPHFSDDKNLKIGSTRFNQYLLLDAALCGLLVVVLIATKPEQWLLASICAFIATSPDFMWMPAYLQTLKGKAFVLTSHLPAKLHAKIQWCTKPWGIWIELLWAAGMITILAKFI